VLGLVALGCAPKSFRNKSGGGTREAAPTSYCLASGGPTRLALRSRSSANNASWTISSMSCIPANRPVAKSNTSSESRSGVNPSPKTANPYSRRGYGRDRRQSDPGVHT
jgi:hypothetical protein